jgi:HEAT repeat protein
MQHSGNRPNDSGVEVDIRATRLLANRALHDEDPLTRKHAIYLLCMARDPDDIDTFVQALRDPVKEVRNQATRALVTMGEPAGEKLILLLNDPDWKVRYRAAEALGMMKYTKAKAALIERLSDPRDHVRYMAVKALSEFGDEDVRTSIKPCLNDENPYVRKMAEKTLENENL